MKNFLSIIYLSLLTITSTVFANQLDTVKVGTEATYAPFVSMNQSNEITGFETELLIAVFNQMEVNHDITHTSFDGLINDLRIGRFDLIYGGIDITEERARQVLFSDPTYQSKAALIAIKDDNTNLSTKSLNRKTVGALSGSTHAFYIEDEIPSARLNTYPSAQHALNDLGSRVDVVIADMPVLQQWQNSQSQPENYILVEIDDAQYFGNGYAVAASQNNQELIAEFNQALQQVKDNGTYEKIYDSYFN